MATAAQNPNNGRRRFRVTSNSFHNFLEESKLVNFIRKFSLTDKDSSEILLLKDDSLSDSSGPDSFPNRTPVLPKLDFSPLNGTESQKSKSEAGMLSPIHTSTPGLLTSTPRFDDRKPLPPPSPLSGTPLSPITRSSPRRSFAFSPFGLLSPGRDAVWPSSPLAPADNRSFIENASVAKLRLDDLATESPVSKRDSTIDASPRHNGIRKLEFDSTSSTSDSSGSMDLSRPARGITANLSLRGIQDDLMNEVSPFAMLNDDRYVPSPKPLPPVIRKAVPPPPKWYFPQGKPVSMTENDAAFRRVGDAIRSLPGQTCSFENMDKVCKAVGLPLYWKKAIFNCMAKDEGKPITLVDFTIYWKAMTSVAHDEASRFVYTLTGGSGSHLRPEHFVPIVMDVIHTHPGLAFYRTSVEFHDQYCNVVITRIFWNHCRAWAPHLTVDDIRKGDLLEKIVDLEMEEDINKNLRYFSYEHFYVIYCLFWEIDQDHDLKISREDLEKHEKGAIPRMVVNRIFSQSVCRRPTEGPISQVGIKEFTQFLLADEDKTHPSSVDYWFRILDGDGKGVISLYDMESFYDGIQNKLMDEGIDCMKFNDVACNLIDAIRPKQETVFRLADLKNNKMAPRFFNSFVNWRKFYVQETTEGSDPVRLEDDNGAEITDWDRFCAEEYESLMEADADQVDAYDVNLDDEDEEHLTNGGAVSYNQLL